jgi:hypothetical protein
LPFNTRLKMLRKGIIKINSPWILNLKYSISKATFDYITDSLSLSPLSDSKLNRGLTASVTKQTKTGGTWSFVFQYQYVFKSSDDTYQYNFPIGNKGLSTLKEVSIGTPTAKPDPKLTIDYRELILDGDETPVLGINPSLSYLCNSSKINLQVILYFINNKSSDKITGLQGGVKIGYLNTTNDFLGSNFLNFRSDKMYLQLFLSTPFDIFGLTK